MTDKSKCSECGGTTEAGFLPEVAPSASPMIPISSLTVWYGGAWDPQKFLGFNTGGTKIDWAQAEPVTAYRCRDCGFVKLYASKQKTT